MPHVPPPVIALAAGVAQRRLASGRRPGRLRRLAAGGVAAGSAWLIGGSVDRFRRTGTTINPLDPSRTTGLVTDGPNGVTRNPMYLGMAGMLSAHGLLRGGVATVVPVAAFVAVIDRLQIRPEEAALRQRFGQSYDDYCRRVRRWV
jgi:protein-S-isoprenylcysteine O-methyltransferase Ste14